ncbi:MAG: hypothetical protein V3R68_02355 [Gammaproteobacteria bacterium]
MKIPGYCIIPILLVLHGCAQPIHLEPDFGHQGPLAGDPYLGIVVKDIADAEGAVIESIPPGPLLRTLQQDPVIDHGDLLLQIDNHPVTAETLSKIINRYLPGDSVVLKFGKLARSITESTGGIKPAIAPIEIQLILDSRQNWTGPISVTRMTGIRDDPDRITPLSTETSQLEAFYLPILAGHKLDIPINRIISFFRSWRDRSFGYHSLGRVMYPFYYPTRLVELQQKVTGKLSAITANPELYLDHLADNLDLERPEQSQKSVTTGPGDTWDRIKKAIVTASHFVDNAFVEFDPIERGMLRDDMRYFLTELSQGRTIPAQSDPQRSIRVLRSSMRVDFQSLLSAAASLSEFMRRDLTFADPPDVKQTSIPAAVSNAISGDVIAIEKTGPYWLVYGGKNKNRYGGGA